MVMFINLVLIPYLRKNENASKKEFGGTLMEQVIYSDILQDYVFHLPRISSILSFKCLFPSMLVLNHNSFYGESKLILDVHICVKGKKCLTIINSSL